MPERAERADALAALPVLDERGASIELGTLWRDRTAVLLFTRHFGCIHCREHVVQVFRVVDRIHAAGAELHVIGNGAPNFIAGFRDATGYPGPLYTDPGLRAYEAAGLERSVMRTLDPTSLFPAARALVAGRRQGRTQGDQWQQGGLLIVTADGEIRHRHASRKPGDNLAAPVIVAALERATRAP